MRNRGRGNSWNVQDGRCGIEAGGDNPSAVI